MSKHLLVIKKKNNQGRFLSYRVAEFTRVSLTGEDADSRAVPEGPPPVKAGEAAELWGPLHPVDPPYPRVGKLGRAPGGEMAPRAPRAARAAPLLAPLGSGPALPATRPPFCGAQAAPQAAQPAPGPASAAGRGGAGNAGRRLPPEGPGGASPLLAQRRPTGGRERPGPLRGRLPAASPAGREFIS